MIVLRAQDFLEPQPWTPQSFDLGNRRVARTMKIIASLIVYDWHSRGVTAINTKPINDGAWEESSHLFRVSGLLFIERADQFSNIRMRGAGNCSISDTPTDFYRRNKNKWKKKKNSQRKKNGIHVNGLHRSETGFSVVLIYRCDITQHAFVVCQATLRQSGVEGAVLPAISRYLDGLYIHRQWLFVLYLLWIIICMERICRSRTVAIIIKMIIIKVSVESGEAQERSMDTENAPYPYIRKVFLFLRYSVSP